MTKRMTILETGLKSSISRTRWLLASGFILTAILVVSVFYTNTILSAVHIWETRETYSYAYAVLPLAGYLVWMRREHFRASVPNPNFFGPLVVVMFSALWLVGGKLDILELEHLAFPGVLIGVLVSAIGWQNSLHFSLPMAYLFLLAPAGSPLLPFLQDITTLLATFFLWLGSIPFYVEGHLIEVATGKYEVAPGCAGLNFVLALATVAPIFAEMMYTHWIKKIIVLSVMMMFVPIANGIRVFGIIAIAEYTNRAIDISDDHLFYGWVFFSSIVLVMFGIGTFWSDNRAAPTPIMPWGGHYTLAELIADPIMVRLRFVLMITVFAGITLPILELFDLL